jgi:hypothetical protein
MAKAEFRTPFHKLMHLLSESERTSYRISNTLSDAAADYLFSLAQKTQDVANASKTQAWATGGLAVLSTLSGAGGAAISSPVGKALTALSEGSKQVGGAIQPFFYSSTVETESQRTALQNLLQRTIQEQQSARQGAEGVDSKRIQIMQSYAKANSN